MLNELQEQWCSESRWDFSDLKALFLNCTLKKSPDLSHTEGLIKISRAIMEQIGVSVESLRPVDHDRAATPSPDRSVRVCNQLRRPRRRQALREFDNVSGPAFQSGPRTVRV